MAHPVSQDRAARPLPAQEELQRLLDYDPATGAFHWRANVNMRGRLPEPGTIRAGYRDICINRVHYGSHRLAWKLFYGSDPLGQIDHINGDRSDNRIANLREATALEQRRNAAMPRTNSSGVVGVSYRPDKGKWRAFISCAGRRIHLGYYATRKDAITARRSAEKALGFHANHGRRP